MTIVTLVSGGMDSTLMALMIKDEGMSQYPLVINYGQLGFRREVSACRRLFKRYALPKPQLIDIRNWGVTISSGITDRSKRIFEDAFLPGRNLMFLLIAASYAYRINATTVAIGLLSDETTIFPDQTKEFCNDAQVFLSKTIGRRLDVITPLKAFHKRDIVAVARDRGIRGTYSCHSGTKKPCGECVACREYLGILEV